MHATKTYYMKLWQADLAGNKNLHVY